jgi:hypothetical protein
MVVARVVPWLLLSSLLIVLFAATPAAACHRSGDLCLPCADSTEGACDLAHDVDGLSIIGQLQEYVFPEPAEESMHGNALGSDERRGYLAIQFEWDTENHTAPTGHADVPFRLEFTPEAGVDWDGDTESTFTFMASDTRETLYFGFTAPDGDVDIEYTIVANDGLPNQQELSGTMTFEDDGGTVEYDWMWALTQFWPMWLLILIVGLAVGALLGMRRAP